MTAAVGLLDKKVKDDLCICRAPEGSHSAVSGVKCSAGQTAWGLCVGKGLDSGQDTGRVL